MNKNKLMMFFILQFILIISNVFNLDSELFSIELPYILKSFIICFGVLYILFISKLSKNTKILFLSMLLFISSLLLFENDSLYKIINYFYYIITYSFIFSYYHSNSIKKYKIINLSTMLLVVLNIYILITKSNSLTLEIIANILLPISFTYFESNKKVSFFVIMLSLLTGYFNSMNLIIYNLIFISFILFGYFIIRKEYRIISGLTFLLIIFISVIINLFSMDKIYESFCGFDINFELYSIITILPLVIFLLVALYNVTKNKNISLGLIINTYTLMLITSFAILSIKNIENEFIIIIYSYLFILEKNRIQSVNKNLEDSVTILALHLGYGGIEQYISSLTKMINKKIDIISTYKLYDSTPFEYRANISYLMNYGPNTKEIKESFKNKRIINIINEGIKSLKILYLKKYENIEAIENINSKYIITTRDFHNELVGFYSRKDIIKIATEHNYHNNNKKYIRRIVNSVNNLNYFVLVSSYLKDYYKDKARIETVYIPNVIESLPRNKSNNYEHNLISIGRLSKVKAQEDLIELVYLLKKDYKDIKLTLVGDGEEKENLEKLIKEKKLTKNVKITGFLNKDEIAKELVNNNIFVTTSKSESFGLVAIEACSYHLPVVAFDSALGLKEILDNNCGILIKNRDLKEMKNEIEKLFNDKKYRDEISKNGYLNSKKYLIYNVSEMWKKIVK